MFEIPKAYSLVKEFDLKDIASRGYLLKHIKTGARVALMENDDENKVFYIGFRTPPADSTGVAHILEHSVLCGSEKYPIKDPFVELAKGSLNTFLNAMTYPDKTVYPVASENDRDFANLMDVYIDAVLNPNIYKNEKIFRQEGWHYEVSEEGDLFVNGVVFNEMKGAYSSPDDVLERETFRALFPDNAYSNDSGGNPENIPQLTYEEFLDFHRRYYHPSNSFIYLYGNCDMNERLSYIDSEYLSKYEALCVDSEIKLQKPFEKISDITMEYPVPQGDDVTENSYLSVNYTVGDILDPKLYQAFNVLDYALLSAPGAPLRRNLMTNNIGKDVIGGYSNGTRQPYFTIGVKGAKPKDKDRFLRMVKRTLHEQIKNGIDKDSLRAAINIQEFAFREADFGSYPKGLIYGLICLDSWIYDDNDPFMHLGSIDILNELKKDVETDYFEKLTEEYLINNTHGCVISLNPKEGLLALCEDAEKERLSAFKASLNEGEIESIKKECEDLKQFQSIPTSPEDLRSLPMLSREDLRKSVKEIKNRKGDISGIPVLYHDVETNGIIYLSLLFDIGDITKEEIFDIALCDKMMGLLDTENYTYAKLSNEINVNTGGLYTHLQVYPADKEDLKFYYLVSSKFLREKTGRAFELVEELMLRTKWEDEKRMKEQLNQEILHFKVKMQSSGHNVSAQRAKARFSRDAYIFELMSGIEFYNYLKDFLENFEDRIKSYKERMGKFLSEKVFRKQGMLISVTANSELSKEIIPHIEKLAGSISDNPVGEPLDMGVLDEGNAGFKTAAAIQYVCRAGNFKHMGYEFTGCLHVLKTILSYEYFWINVRVKGGAYGCMAGFKRNGDTHFVSYRDPKLSETNEVFEKTPEFVASFDVDERDMTKYVIGTVSSMDTPMTPSQEGDRGLNCYIMGLDEALLQKERDQVLNASCQDIRDLEGIIKAVVDNKVICVLGNEAAIEAEKSLFDKVVTLT